MTATTLPVPGTRWFAVLHKYARQHTWTSFGLGISLLAGFVLLMVLDSAL